MKLKEVYEKYGTNGRPVIFKDDQEKNAWIFSKDENGLKINIIDEEIKYNSFIDIADDNLGEFEVEDYFEENIIEQTNTICKEDWTSVLQNGCNCGAIKRYGT